jgi:hypothetical protein
MYYRIINYDYVPYAVAYNSTDLEQLWKELYERDKEYFDYDKISLNDIITDLKSWYRDIAWYYIEQQETPFDTKDLDF